MDFVSRLASFATLALAVGCGRDTQLGGPARSDAATSSPATDADSPGSALPLDSGVAAATDAGYALPGNEFRFSVPATGRIGLNLGSLTTTDNTSQDSLGWDLAFKGFALLTNSGPSGSGSGGAVGPISAENLLFDEAPPVPLSADRAFGTLSSWYHFGATGVESRFHIYAIRSGQQLWKFQVLEYHGTIDGQSVSGVYQVRYASVDAKGEGPVQTIVDLDATAGGLSPTADKPGTCLNLDSGKTRELTPASWVERDDWHLCFRRTDLVANSGFSGPGDVAVADLDANAEFDESLQRTADSETARFNALDYIALTDPALTYSADNLTRAAIGYEWLQGEGASATLTPGAWLVRAADGAREYLLLFTALSGATDETPGTITARVKQVTPLAAAMAHP